MRYDEDTFEVQKMELEEVGTAEKKKSPDEYKKWEDNARTKIFRRTRNVQGLFKRRNKRKNYCPTNKSPHAIF